MIANTLLREERTKKMIYDKLELVREFTSMGYKLSLDVATNLLADGYDISVLERDLDGFDIYDLIYEKELYDN